MVAIMSVAGIAIFMPISYQFEARFDAVFGRSIPRVGITQILLFTALYGFLASKTFGKPTQPLTAEISILHAM